MSIMKSQPWYREPWPWILITLPMTAVVASMITIWLAIKSADGLVEDDYYKQGIGINKTLHRDQAAQDLHLGAYLSLGSDGRTISVNLSGKLAGMPDTLQLSLLHPTQAHRDLHISLQEGAKGRYSALVPNMRNGRWDIVLEAPQGDWRLTGRWLAGQQIIHLGAAEKSE